MLPFSSSKRNFSQIIIKDLNYNLRLVVEDTKEEMELKYKLPVS